MLCRGYLSPEYASFGQVSEKVDVFSFGILVLEIVSGRKNINLRLPAEQRYILEWVSNGSLWYFPVSSCSHIFLNGKDIYFSMHTNAGINMVIVMLYYFAGVENVRSRDVTGFH